MPHLGVRFGLEPVGFPIFLTPLIPHDGLLANALLLPIRAILIARPSANPKNIWFSFHFGLPAQNQ